VDAAKEVMPTTTKRPSTAAFRARLKIKKCFQRSKQKQNLNN
jgi:hypothetical protein